MNYLYLDIETCPRAFLQKKASEKNEVFLWTTYI